MADFECYRFDDTTYGLSHLPQSTQLFIETTNYIYYVSADDNKELWKYTKATGTDEQLDVDPGDAWGGDDQSRPQNIKAAYYWRSQGLIYFADFGANAGYVWHIDISDDTVTEDGGVTVEYDSLEDIHDIFVIEDDSTVYVLGFEYEDNPGLDFYYVTIYKVDAGVNHMASYTLTFDECTSNGTHAVIIGSNAWFIIDTSSALASNRLYRYTHNAAVITNKYLFGFEGTKLSSNDNLLYTVYDNDDRLYFYYNSKVQYYSISGLDVTELENVNVGFMLDRNCIGTANSPWEQEKGFHLTDPNIYTIHKKYGYLLKLQSLATGTTIKAITDNYLIDSNKNVYEYTNIITNVPRLFLYNTIHGIPKIHLTLDNRLSSDQVIEIYQNNSGTYTLLFRGLAGVPEYNNRTALYIFRSVNLGGSDFTKSITYTATAKTAPTIAKLMLSDSKVSYIYTSPSYLKTTATALTYTFDDQELRNNLMTVNIRTNSFWYMEPMGRFNLRGYTTMINSSIELSASNCMIVKYHINQLSYNIWDIDGGWDSSSNAVYNTRYVDSAQKQEFGELEWKGRSVFPEARSQAATSSIAVAYKSWNGMQDNPYFVKTARELTTVAQVGQKCNFQFSHLSNDFGTASSFCIIGSEVDLKKKREYLLLSKSIIIGG